MPHIRKRAIAPHILEQGKFWPIVGLLGPRQSGKTTLLRHQLSIPNVVSLDDEIMRESAESSAKIFLSRLETPVVIDEIQKVPKLFDALKAIVDQKKIPGQFYVTGSTHFSAKLGIRESLTGRIGLSYLQPLTLAELSEKAFPKNNPLDFTNQQPTVDLLAFTKQMDKGGMPVPAFLRDVKKRSEYWTSWLDTTIYRDMPKLVGLRFDPAFAFSLLRKISKILGDGELPTLKLFDQSAAKVRKYLQAFEELFILKRIPRHDYGTGKERWIFFDCGLLSYFSPETHTEELTLSLARHQLWHETSARLHKMGVRDERVAFKSQKGSEIDWVWNEIPMKIITSTKQIGWQERALFGAMKKLDSKVGYLIAPVDKPQMVKEGIGLLPWHHWS